MSPDGSPNPEFLPRHAGARIVIALLALPSFLVSTICLIAIPIAAGPPTDLASVIGALFIGELCGLGALVTGLALVWAVAAPRWLEDLLHCRARQLISVAGGFLVVNGAVLLPVLLTYGAVVPAVILSVGIVMGIAIIRRNPLRGP